MISQVQLGDVCQIIAGQHIEAALYGGEPEGTPYLTGPADFGNRIPTVSKWTKAPKVFGAQTDVLLTVKGAGVGKANLGCDAAIGRQLMALRPDTKRLTQSFLFHFIRERERVIAALAQGATVPGIGKDDVAGIPMLLPSLRDQQRIAVLLDRAEALRDKRRATLDQLDTLTQSIFLDMFGDARMNPESWPRVPLESLIVDGPQNGLYKPGSDYGSGLPILRIDAFYDGAVTDLASLKRVRVTEDEARVFALRPDDIVINRVNSPAYLGKSALIPTLLEPTIFESNMMRFSVERREVEPRYLVQFLQTGFVRSQIASAAKPAVNQSSINQQDVKALRINRPPLHLQQTFLFRASRVERLMATQRASLAHLDALFASLQHRAFRGEL